MAATPSNRTTSADHILGLSEVVDAASIAYGRDQVRSAAEEGSSLCVTVESVSNLHFRLLPCHRDGSAGELVPGKRCDCHFFPLPAEQLVAGDDRTASSQRDQTRSLILPAARMPQPWPTASV